MKLSIKDRVFYLTKSIDLHEIFTKLESRLYNPEDQVVKTKEKKKKKKGPIPEYKSFTWYFEGNSLSFSRNITKSSVEYTEILCAAIYLDSTLIQLDPAA